MAKKRDTGGQKELCDKVLNMDLCTSCGACGDICPYTTIYKDRMPEHYGGPEIMSLLNTRPIHPLNVISRKEESSRIYTVIRRENRANSCIKALKEMRDPANK